MIHDHNGFNYIIITQYIGSNYVHSRRILYIGIIIYRGGAVVPVVNYCKF